MTRQQKLYKLAPKPSIGGFRRLKPEDIPQVHKLLMAYLPKFKL
jgi:hypothetical protein